MVRLRAIDGCLNEHDVIKMKDMPRFDADVNVAGATVTRKMVKITVKDKTMYADAITGTLYNPKTGRCNSTRLFIEKVYKL